MRGRLERGFALLDRFGGEGGGARGGRGLSCGVSEWSPNGPPARLRALPLRRVLGVDYPVATTRRSRLLGLAFLDRDQAGAGLVIPGCRSVHGFGMRFTLDVWFLGAAGEVVEVRRLERRRVVFNRAARDVLEVAA
jgi:hypothetical protein